MNRGSSRGSRGRCCGAASAVMLAVVAAISLGGGAAGGYEQAAEAAAACHVTHPNGSTPPGEQRSPRHHGNGRLWSSIYGGRLTVPATVQTGRVGLQQDGSIKMKFWWWGSKKAGRRLTVTGSRLDRADAPLRSEVNQGSSTEHAPHFWPSYLYFPHEGCWRVRARAGSKAKLRFTIEVKIAEPAS